MVAGPTGGAPLRSGWRSVLAALTASAFDADANVVRAGQVALRFAFDRGLSQSPSLLFGDASDALFADCVACMAAFACAPPADADAALVLFGAIAEMLAGLPALPRARTDSPQRGQLKGGKPQLVSGAEQRVAGVEVRWWMLCDALVGIAAQCESSRRAPAIGALFALLTRHASTLDGSFWARVYERVVSPLFEVGRGVAGTEASDVWMAATVEATLTPLVALLGSCEPAMRAMTGKVSELLGELLLGPWSVQELAGAQLRALCCALSALGAGEEPWAATMEALESAASALAPVASQHAGGEGGTPLSPDSELAAIASSHDALFQSDESAASDGGAVTSAGAGAAVNVLHTVGSLALTRAVATVLTECGSTIPGGARFRCRELLGRLARDAGAMLASSSGGARDATLDPMAVDVLAQQEAEAGEVYMSMLMMEMDDGGAPSAAARRLRLVRQRRAALRLAEGRAHRTVCGRGARAAATSSRGTCRRPRVRRALPDDGCGRRARRRARANAIADTMEAVVARAWPRGDRPAGGPRQERRRGAPPRQPLTCNERYKPHRAHMLEKFAGIDSDFRRRARPPMRYQKACNGARGTRAPRCAAWRPPQGAPRGRGGAGAQPARARAPAGSEGCSCARRHATTAAAACALPWRLPQLPFYPPEPRVLCDALTGRMTMRTCGAAAGVTPSP